MWDKERQLQYLKIWRDEHKDYFREWHQRHKQQGLCIDCNEKVAIGHTRCARHLSLVVQRNRKLYQRRVCVGKCYRCGAPLLDGEDKYCIGCIIESGGRLPIVKVVKYASAE